MSGRIWIDASAGASGDMILGALLGVGVPVGVIEAAISAVSPEPISLAPVDVRRGGFAAVHCGVQVADSTQHRSWRDINSLLGSADLEPPVAELAGAVFQRLAVAEASVHGTDPLDVSFHEVGALDAIADVVGACAGFVHLGVGRPETEVPKTEVPGTEVPGTEVIVSRVAVGSGQIHGAHGPMPVPPPAVAELLRGAPSYAGRDGAPEMELCTPTGAALLTTIATSWAPQPEMRTRAIGVGAGTKDPPGYPNLLRIFLGDHESSSSADHATPTPLQIETNVDDLDPRVWPSVIAALLDAGASDAWLTPILMKKGRPAHTLSVLTQQQYAESVRAVIFRHTSAIGLRERPIGKHALEREMVEVEVGGHPIAVKLARYDGIVVNAQPEYEDAARAARALSRPVNDVLADAIGHSRRFFDADVPELGETT